MSDATHFADAHDTKALERWLQRLNQASAVGRRRWCGNRAVVTRDSPRHRFFSCRGMTVMRLRDDRPGTKLRNNVTKSSAFVRTRRASVDL